jgi:adenylate kinase family enzyme
MSLPHGIIVFGASGSGTTTFGRELAEQLHFAHLDADDFFWEDTAIPFTVKRAREQRINKLREAIRESGEFVLSGSIVGWDEAVIQSLDLAIYVKTPTEVRIERLKAREYARFGDRILDGGDMFDNHREFVEWARTYDTAGMEQRSRTLHMEWAKTLKCPLIELDGTSDFHSQAGNIALRYYTKRGDSERLTVTPIP